MSISGAGGRVGNGMVSDFFRARFERIRDGIIADRIVGISLAIPRSHTWRERTLADRNLTPVVRLIFVDGNRVASRCGLIKPRETILDHSARHRSIVVASLINSVRTCIVKKKRREKYNASVNQISVDIHGREYKGSTVTRPLRQNVWATVSFWANSCRRVLFCAFLNVIPHGTTYIYTFKDTCDKERIQVSDRHLTRYHPHARFAYP